MKMEESIRLEKHRLANLKWPIINSLGWTGYIEGFDDCYLEMTKKERQVSKEEVIAAMERIVGAFQFEALHLSGIKSDTNVIRLFEWLRREFDIKDGK